MIEMLAHCANTGIEAISAFIDSSIDMLYSRLIQTFPVAS